MECRVGDTPFNRVSASSRSCGYKVDGSKFVFFAYIHIIISARLTQSVTLAQRSDLPKSKSTEYSS